MKVPPFFISGIPLYFLLLNLLISNHGNSAGTVVYYAFQYFAHCCYLLLLLKLLLKAFVGVLFLEEEVSYHKKHQLSPAEEAFLCHLLTLDKCTPKQKLLNEIAESIYGKKITELKPKPCSSFVAAEALLMETAILYLRVQMEHLHYSVTQMAFNMAKVAGDVIIHGLANLIHFCPSCSIS